jgi:glutamate 5-kinase
MLNNAKRIVIKVGSSLLIGPDGHVRGPWLATLAQDIRRLKHEGKQVIIVTSGAVALGRHVLGYGARALLLEEKQAAAACGQVPLFSHWAAALAQGEVVDALYPAQILLTADDSIQRRRYLNARNTLETLLENGRIVPLINENDTVATAEIRFGDNDRLAARVAQMAGAELLVIFSDIDGLYSNDPGKHPQAEFIAKVDEITPEIERMAGDAASEISSGGMTTKIAAAKIANAAGCHMAIARGTADHPLQALFSGGKHTLFVAQKSPAAARKQWISGAMHPAGSVTVDAGAAKALAGGKSLLPAGVTAVAGAFGKGDVVLVKTPDGKTVARGLIAYDADDARAICGKQSGDIERILGFKRRDVLIHRDDLVLE